MKLNAVAYKTEIKKKKRDVLVLRRRRGQIRFEQLIRRLNVRKTHTKSKPMIFFRHRTFVRRLLRASLEARFRVAPCSCVAVGLFGRASLSSAKKKGRNACFRLSIDFSSSPHKIPESSALIFRFLPLSRSRAVERLCAFVER